MKKKEIIPLTIEKINHVASKKPVIYAKKKLVLMTMIKYTKKSEITVITLENIEAPLVLFTPKEIPVVFHNGSNYDYHFTIKASRGI